jgi:hypothetical protein
MVHGLRTIEALNRRAVRKTNGKQNKRPKADIPLRISLNPVLARAYVNRPWNESEKANREPIRGPLDKKKEEPESIRT